MFGCVFILIFLAQLINGLGAGIIETKKKSDVNIMGEGKANSIKMLFFFRTVFLILAYFYKHI